MNVLAAGTAAALGALEEGRSRVSLVIAAQPEHIAAHVVAADLALAVHDLAGELRHVQIAFAGDEGATKLGLRLVRRLLVADRLERAGEVLDILLAGDPDERTLGHLDRLIGRLERRCARPGR
ncbi:MAG: hypothetical protein GY713_07520 [Actinomycetia bacterium]|nr:hypothetical protein [Actinomycetes bacterium]